MIEYLINLAVNQMFFWITWILIPIIIEIIPSIISVSKLMMKNLRKKNVETPDKLPFISIVVPVYNSERTLYQCIKSINDSSYPIELMQVIFADNNTNPDKSFEIFDEAHNKHFPTMNMYWMKTESGKAKALNAALYETIGTYIINIDSDGILEKNALMNLILTFENDSEISAMTGTIFTQKEKIKSTKNIFLKLLQVSEYFEYAQAFLSGRSIEADKGQLFTMAGAFSAFRKEVLYSTFLYNINTVGEDTDMTFQIREGKKKKVGFCPEAIFFVDPIDSLDSLYLQRQRWQRGEIEVTENYMGENAIISNFFKNFMVRRMMIDHTFVFPKMIWMFASIILIMFGYSLTVLIFSYFIIYLLYIFVDFLNYICAHMLLRSFKKELKFYSRFWWVIFILPFYTFICSWIRLVGILNTMTKSAQWNSQRFTAEIKLIKSTIYKDIKKLFKGD
ncbi:TIGR03111 family XrtG-associated glycosyltransferase [Lactococcus lactis]